MTTEMTVEERLICVDNESKCSRNWTETLAMIGRHIREAVEHAQKEIIEVHNRNSELVSKRDKLQAELATVQPTSEKTTAEEAKKVWQETYAGTGFQLAATEIDRITAKRVAANREKFLAAYREEIECNERQEKLIREERERHAKELQNAVASEREKGDATLAREDAIWEGICNELREKQEIHTKELQEAVAAERERWKTHYDRSAIASAEREGYVNEISKEVVELRAERERHAAELAQERENAVYWQGVNERALVMAKAAAYEEAARVADAHADFYADNAPTGTRRRACIDVAIEIRQLAAKATEKELPRGNSLFPRPEEVGEAASSDASPERVSQLREAGLTWDDVKVMVKPFSFDVGQF